MGLLQICPTLEIFYRNGIYCTFEVLCRIVYQKVSMFYEQVCFKHYFLVSWNLSKGNLKFRLFFLVVAHQLHMLCSHRLNLLVCWFQQDFIIFKFILSSHFWVFVSNLFLPPTFHEQSESLLQGRSKTRAERLSAIPN